MFLCVLELFFACRRPECKFLEKSVRAGVNNLFTVLSFTVQNNTANIIQKYGKSRDVSLNAAEHCIESHELQVRSGIVLGRTVALARSENDHQNEKEDSSRYQELQQVAMKFWVAAHRGEIQS
jgi:hypothetical protein